MPVIVAGGFFFEDDGSMVLEGCPVLFSMEVAQGAFPFPGTPIGGLAAHGATPVTPNGGCFLAFGLVGGLARGGGMLLWRPVAPPPAARDCFGGGLQSPMPAWSENRWLNAGAAEAVVGNDEVNKDDFGGVSSVSGSCFSVIAGAA